MSREAPWESKKERAPPLNKCGHTPPQASEVESNFSKKLHTHLGEGPGTGQKEKRNKIIRQR